MTNEHRFATGHWACFAGVVLLTIAVSRPPLAAQPTDSPHSGVIKLSGCLRSSAAGDTKTAPQPVIYTLDVAAASDEAGTAKAATAKQRAEGKSRAPLKAATYTITAPAAIGLAAHVNHRVELTGRMRENIATTTGTPGPPSPESPEASSPSAAAANRTFEVESLKMLSTSCPPRAAR
jgi:hypothetical protein